MGTYSLNRHEGTLSCVLICTPKRVDRRITPHHPRLRRWSKFQYCTAKASLLLYNIVLLSKICFLELLTLSKEQALQTQRPLYYPIRNLLARPQIQAYSAIYPWPCHEYNPHIWRPPKGSFGVPTTSRIDGAVF